MKKFYYLLSLIVIFSFVTISCETTSLEEITLESIQNKKGKDKTKKCATIQSGKISYPNDHHLAGSYLSNGFDIFGYNYQAHIFKGLYANIYLGEAGFPPYKGNNDEYLSENPEVVNNWYIMTYYWPYRNDEVNMTWNDAWQPNKDCDNDGFLDVLDYPEILGSGGWENFHSKGTYVNSNGKLCQWEQHSKIIALPENSTKVDDYWFDVDGNEIGKNFYNYWAIIQIGYNDPCGEGVEIEKYLSPFRAGLGNR